MIPSWPGDHDRASRIRAEYLSGEGDIPRKAGDVILSALFAVRPHLTEVIQWLLQPEPPPTKHLVGPRRPWPPFPSVTSSPGPRRHRLRC